ncbi:MAG: hypothetical protein Q9201_005845 [Fulgogasparrea decipioides]
MDSQNGSTPGPTAKPLNRSDPDIEAMKIAASNYESAVTRFQRLIGSKSSIAQPDVQLAAERIPAQMTSNGGNSVMVPPFEKIEERPKDAVGLDRAIVETETQEARPEPPVVEGVLCENGQSFEIRDSALGESLSETEMHKREPVISQPALIVKFSTTGPCRINSIERQGSSPSLKQTSDPIPNRIVILDQPGQAFTTPPAQTTKRRPRGRPHGSKNKNPSTKPRSYSESMSSPISGLGNQGGAISNNKSLKSLRISEAMKASWAKRRSNGTSGHRGGPPSEKTLLKNNHNANSLEQHIVASGGQNFDSHQRQLFKGQHAIRSASGSGLLKSAPRSSTSTGNRRPTSSHGTLNVSGQPNIQEKLQVSLPIKYPSLSELSACCNGVAALMQIFEKLIFPVLIASRTFHHDVLPDETLLAICKQVADETVDDRLKTVLKDNEYQLNKCQRKLVKKYVRKSYATKVKNAQEHVLEPPVSQSSGSGSVTDPGNKGEPTTPPVVEAGRDTARVHGTAPLPDALPANPNTVNHGSAEEIPLETKEHQKRRIASVPGDAHPSDLLVTKPATAFNPELEMALANAALFDEAGKDRPYKSSKRGHCDFVREEGLSLLHALDKLDQVPNQDYRGKTIDQIRQKLKARLGRASEDRITAIIRAVHAGSRTALAHRKRKSIRAFLIDVVEDTIPTKTEPKIAVPQAQVQNTVTKPEDGIGLLLWNRELGSMSISTFSGILRSKNDNLSSTLYDRAAEDLRPWRSWKGASGDIVTVTWAPDSLSYAVGAVAQSDDDDLQYNRPYNLLSGELISNTLTELPDHRVERPKPDTIRSGPNSTYAVYQACDPMVYKTVTSVEFSPWGRLLYTASHDKTAKIWDVTSGRPTCLKTLSHNAEVTSLEVSTHYPGCFATAAKAIDHAIRVYQTELHDTEAVYRYTGYSSSQATKHRDRDIYPECIKWGLAPGTKHLLLGGFQQWVEQDDFSAARQGQICLWDIESGENIRVRPHSSSILAAAWHPQENTFATGGAPGGGPLSYPATTKSVVRSYDTRNTSGYMFEFECPALDMQDVTFHPSNSTYISAACTDGSTYVWDYRRPDHVLHDLAHGEPLQELGPNDEGLPYIEYRERVDAGVMLSIWGSGASQFYTGSSDGVIKAWDILRAPEDVWIRDVACLPAGVQSGALSPDGMHMLVGDAVGGVHILSAAPFGLSVTNQDDDDIGCNSDPIDLVAAAKTNDIDGENPGTEGIEAGKELLQSGQLLLHPTFGVGKGPNYHGPFAKSARWNNQSSGYCELLPRIDKQQAFSVNGKEQPEQSAKIKALISARREQMLAAKDDSKRSALSFGPPAPFVSNKRLSATANSRTSADVLGPEDAIITTPSFSRTNFECSKETAAQTLPPEFIDLDHYIPSPRFCVAPNGYTVATSTQKRRRSDEIGIDNRKAKRVRAMHGGDRRDSADNVTKKTDASKIEIVDLTGDDGDDNATPLTVNVSGKRLPSVTLELQKREPRLDDGAPKVEHEDSAATKETVMVDLEEGHQDDDDVKEEGSLLAWEEWVEEDHWWPKGC